MLLSELLADHAHGQVDREGGELLANLASDCRLYDKAGTYTLEVKVEPKGSKLVLSIKHKAKSPTADAEIAIYYLGDEGLTKDDPLQMSFADLAEVDPDTGEIRRLPDTTSEGN